MNNIGTITNSGGGLGAVTLNSTIGPNVTNVIQNSSTSMLVLSSTNPTWFGGLQINLGTVKTTGGITTAAPTGNGTITLGNATTGGGTTGGNVTLGSGTLTMQCLCGGRTPNIPVTRSLLPAELGTGLFN